MLGDRVSRKQDQLAASKGIERTEHFGQVDISVHGRKEGRLDGEGA